MSDLVFRSTANGGDNTLAVSSVSATVPSGTASGDLQTLWVGCLVLAPATPPGIITPSGWDLRGASSVISLAGGVGNAQLHCFTRLAGGSESSATVATVGSVNAALTWARTAYRNPDGTTPFGQVSFGSASASTTATVTGITTARNNSTREIFLAQGVAQAVTSSGTGMIERGDNATYGISTHSEHQPIKGASGNATFTLPSSSDYGWGHAEFYSASGDQMAVIGAGAQTVSTTSGGTLSPAYPSGYTAVANDICVLIAAGLHNNTTSLAPSTPSGYTQVETRFREVGTYDLQLTVFVKRLTASEAAPQLTVPAAYSTTSGGLSAQILIVRGVDTTTLQDATAVASDSAAAATWAHTGITTATNEAMVISCVASADDNALALSGGNEQGFAAKMEGAAYDTTTGGDHAVGVATRIVHTAGATTMPTWSQTAVGNDAWAGIALALRAPNPLFTLTPSAPVALSGTASVTGDVVASILFEVSPSAPVALTASAATPAGEVAPDIPFELDYPIQLALSAALSAAGELSIETAAFQVEPAAAIALTGSHAVAGEFSLDVGISPSAAVSLAGAAAIAGGVDIFGPLEVTPTAAVALASAASVSGEPSLDVGLAPTAAVTLEAAAATAGDVDIFGPLEVTPTVAVALSGSASTAGDTQYELDTAFAVEPTAAASIAATLAVAGQLGLGVEVTATSAVALAGAAAAAGEPGLGVDITASAAVAMAGSAAVTGDTAILDGEFIVDPQAALGLAGAAGLTGEPALEIGLDGGTVATSATLAATGAPGLELGLDGGAVPLAGALTPAAAIDFYGPLELTPAQPVALQAQASLAGNIDITLPDTFEVEAAQPVALAGATAVTGAPGLGLELAPAAALPLAGAVQTSGEVISTIAFELEPSAPVALSAAAAAGGEIELTIAFAVAPTAALALGATLQTAAGVLQLEIGIAPAAALALAGAAAVGGDLGVSTSFQVSPAAAVVLDAALAIAGESTQPAWTASGRLRIGQAVNGAAGSRIGPVTIAPRTPRVGGRRL